MGEFYSGGGERGRAYVRRPGPESPNAPKALLVRCFGLGRLVPAGPGQAPSFGTAFRMFLYFVFYFTVFLHAHVFAHCPLYLFGLLIQVRHIRILVL